MKMLRAILCLPILLGSMAANASLLNYEFNLVASGSVDRNGSIDTFSNLSITVTGMTTNDVDLFPPPSGGQYASMSTYDLGVFGTFFTDSSTDEFYTQLVDGFGDLIQVGLRNGAGTLGFAPFIPVPFPADADAGGIALGSNLVPNDTGYIDLYILSNLSGDTLTLDFGAPGSDSGVTSIVTTFSVTAKDVSEPETLALLSLGLLGVAFASKHRH